MAAFICYNEKGCKECSCYRLDSADQRACCFAKEDGQKITQIIVEAWEENKADWLLDNGTSDTFLDFNLWVSYIMCYGYSPAAIYEYARIRGIKIDLNDNDPDDEQDHYGALVLTIENIGSLKGE